MAFLTEPEPARGVALDVLPGIRRVVARNPGVMTYQGTNTYLLDQPDGVTVIDPGPKDDRHVEDIVRAAAGRPIARLVLTHAHSDHHGATKALREATGAACWGYSGGAPEFAGAHGLADGGSVAGLTAVFTPGHAADHLSFEYDVPEIGRILFSGDHVMAWSSSIVNPPEGDMRAYYTSLERLLARDDLIYLPGHGPLTREPKALVEQLLRHRQRREAAILRQLAQQPMSVHEIAGQLYAKSDDALKIAAQRNVLAHLLKLQQEDQVIQLGDNAPIQDPATIPNTQNRETRRAAYLDIVEQDAKRRFSLKS